MEVTRGSVIIVAHGDFGRPRPAVVVQADELGYTTSIIVCPITSEVTEKLPIRPTVDPKTENGLHFRSQIMADKMTALPRERVRRVIGTIDSDARDRLNVALLLVLGLAR
jgi:mRNA interferase MazF